MTLFRKSVAAILLAATMVPFDSSATMVPDPTGLWYVPTESGWGLSIQQQGDTLFVVLYVHDETSRPAWYVASAVRRREGQLDPTGSFPVYGGTLYKADATRIGLPFRLLHVTGVGEVSLHRVPGPGNRLAIAYDVAGVQVTKTVEPQTWGSSRLTALGSYQGAVIFGGVPSGCPTDPGIPMGMFTVAGNAAAPDHVRWVFGSRVGQLTAESCEAEGPWVQRGQQASFTAPVRCGTTSSTPVGTVTVNDIVPSVNGLTGSVTVVRGSCTYNGRLSGTREYP